MHAPRCSGVQGMPSTVAKGLPGGGPGKSGAFTDGGEFWMPPATPLVHTPLNRVGTVPYGQPSAAAGDATANGPTKIAATPPAIRTLRLAVIFARASLTSHRILRQLGALGFGGRISGRK